MDAAKKPIDVVDTKPFVEPITTPSPKTATYHPNAPLDRDTNLYNFNHPNRGKAIIFNHREFEDSDRYKIRVGTMKDAECLETELKKLQFDVETYIDLSLEEVHTIIDRNSRGDHSENDCILFVILSHGHMGAFSTFDSIYILEDLFNAFTADRCPTLAGKPKLFIVQACRLDRNDPIDKGIVFGEKSARASSRALRDYTDRDERKVQMNYSLPSHSDFLVVYSTSPGFYSFRSENGSHFIQALCEELKANATKLPMYTILTNVNRKIATNFEANSDDNYLTGAKQMPCLHSTLTRNLQFNDKTTSTLEMADGIPLMGNGATNGSNSDEEGDGEKSFCFKFMETILCRK